MRDSLRELALAGGNRDICRRREFLLLVTAGFYCVAIPCAESQSRTCCRDCRPSALRRASEPENNAAWKVSPRLLVALGSTPSCNSCRTRSASLTCAAICNSELPIESL